MRRGASLLLLGLLAPASGAPAEVPRERPAEIVLPPPAPPAAAKARDAEVPRGQLLYENHCRGCHESVVHVRERRRAATLAALEGWVRHWADAQALGWAEQEIAEVTEFLNARYYRLAR